MLFTLGYVQLGRWRGVPLRWHVSLPLGVALMSGLELAPWRWLFAFALVLVHEAGHAVMVRRHGLRMVAIDLQGIGGEPRWRGAAAPMSETAIAWGGVLAQVAAFVGARLGILVFGEPTEPWSEDLVYVLTDANLVVMAVHLLPLPTFDGEHAWRVLARRPGQGRLHERVILVHMDDVPVAPEDEVRVRSEVEAELEAIARSHNERAEERRR